MKNLKISLMTAVLAFGLSGCSDPAAEATKARAERVAAMPLLEISWEDLIPEGEDELLEALYVEFYQNLEQNMRNNSTSLAEAARQDGEDVSSMIVEGSANDTMEQIGTFNVVEEIDGQRIRVPGYVVPFDFSLDAQHKEFLLVPYFGACLHTPPPPPNQIIFVKATTAAKIANIEEPVWLEGIIKTGKFYSDTGNSAYELDLTKLEPFDGY